MLDSLSHSQPTLTPTVTSTNIPYTQPLLSVVIVVHNMQRVAPRTLHAFTAAYQNVSPDTYEVIVVENSSDQPLSKQQVEAFGPNFRYFVFPDASPSPTAALNYGVKQAKGRLLGLLIDGAHLVTPGVLNYALRALHAYPNPVVSTLALHLGPQLQRYAIKSGYSEQVEDNLLEQIHWPQAGYQLFNISALTGANAGGWFLPIAESNCVFVLRRTYDAIGGFDERFDLPGGGMANLDFYLRLCEQPNTDLIVLLGEGSFHQMHGGIATNNIDEQAFDNNLTRWMEQYTAIRGKKFIWSTRQPEYWGHLPTGMISFMEHSVQRLVEKTNLPPRPLQFPLLSVVIVVHNMQRVAPRTLHAFTAAYQNVSPDTYEVIVVENGSDQPLSKQQVEAFGPNFRYFVFPDVSSPAAALNYGVKQTKGRLLGLLIDGAHLVTPGVLNYALRALHAYPNPVVSTLALHLGPQLQRDSIKDGYSEQVEDHLLEQIGWPQAGYKLFTISSLADSSAKGWFLPSEESNCIFLLRQTYEAIGGFEEQFDEPDGGLANWDFYYRLSEHPTTQLIVLLGEGSFHQIHEGIATNNADVQATQVNHQRWGEQYKAIRGVDFKPSPRRPDYWGHFPLEAEAFWNHSLQAYTKLTTRQTPPAPTPTIVSLQQKLQAAHASAQATAAELESLRRTKFYRLAAFYWSWRDKLKTTLRPTRK